MKLKLSLPKSSKPALKRLLFGTISVLLPFALVEAVMVLGEPSIPFGMFQYDAELGFRVRSHFDVWSLTTNRHGFNDRDYTLEKPAGTYRLIVLGDSFNWAGSRDKNYVTFLRQALKQRYGKTRIEVMNAGYPNTQTAQQLALLQRDVLPYSPDLVLLGFYVGNDYLEGNPRLKRIVVNGLFLDVERDKERIWWGYPVLPQCRLATFIDQKLKTLTQFEQLNDADGRLKEEAYLRVEYDRMEVASNAAIAAGTYEPNYRYILDSVARMAELLRSRQIRFAVAIYPDEYQVDDNLRRRVLARFGKSETDYNLTYPQQRLKVELDRLGIPYLDLLPFFRAEAAKDGKPLYRLRDTHWNDRGNTLAARHLVDFLIPQLDPDLEKLKM